MEYIYKLYYSEMMSKFRQRIARGETHNAQATIELLIDAYANLLAVYSEISEPDSGKERLKQDLARMKAELEGIRDQHVDLFPRLDLDDEESVKLYTEQAIADILDYDVLEMTTED